MSGKPVAMTSNRPYLLRAVHEWICDNGLTPYIVVDAAWPGVQVPPRAISDGRVILNLAPRAVAHLELGNDAVTCMARFGGASHPVSVPIAAVQAIYARENGQGMLLAEGSAPSPGDGVPAGMAPALQPVPSDGHRQDADAGGSPDAPAGNGGPDKPRPRGKPNLRVIK